MKKSTPTFVLGLALSVLGLAMLGYVLLPKMWVSRYCERAISAEVEGATEKAATLYMAALLIDPRSESCYRALYYLADANKIAISPTIMRQFDRYVELFPDDSQVILLRAKMKLLAGNIDGARADANMASEVSSDSEVEIFFAKLAIIEGDYADAKRNYQATLDLRNPQNREAKAMLKLLGPTVALLETARPH